MNSLEVERQHSLKAGWNSFRKMKLYCKANGTISMSIGPHWFGPVFTTFAVIFVFMVNRVVVEKSNCTVPTKELLFYLALVICATGQLFLMCTALIDGGTLVTGPSDEECATLVSEKKAVPFCDECMVYQINNAAHCSFCDCCVEDLDHHCPWMGKCVGKGNMFWFKCFMATVVIYLVQFAVVGLKYS